MNPISNIELKYVFSLCDNASEEIIEDLITYLENNNYATHQQENESQSLSDKSIEWLLKNLKTHPTIVLYYASKFMCLPNTGSVSHIHELILTIVDSLLDVYTNLSNNNETFNIGPFLALISQLKSTPAYENDRKKNIISKIHQLKSAGHNKEIYLSLIARGDNHILKELIEYEMKQPSLLTWNLDANKIVELCFGFKKHWLLEIISNLTENLTDNAEMPFYSNLFIKVVWQIILINVVNSFSNNTDITVILAQLKILFSTIEYQNCEEKLFLYINEIYRELNLIKFCTINSSKKLSFGWCEQLQCRSALSLISQTCDLSRLDLFKVKQALTFNNELLHKLNNTNSKPTETYYWDIMAYNSYRILTSIIDIILNSNSESVETISVKHNIEEIKVMVSNLHPMKYRLEILQNIFASLFLRYEYFSNEENFHDQNFASHSDGSYFTMKGKSLRRFSENTGFICQPSLALELLSIIKESLSGMLRKYTDKSSQANTQSINQKALAEIEEDIKNFENVVSNAMWRWQLITSLKMEVPQKPVSILCLYDSMIEKSSDEEEIQPLTLTKRKIKTKKRHSKSDNENIMHSSKQTENEGLLVGHLRSYSDKPDFITLMLSPPNSLLALCLEANDFSKANRILEIYDMHDTEGSIEVSFSKHFLAIAAQIKSSISFSDIHSSSSTHQMEKVTGTSLVSATVVSLVQGFLSTYRAPYNCQLSELVHTFPQLQLYDHCNSPLISIVDMLLCTGLDRNITYGILNVAEKKCQEIKITSDVEMNKCNFLVFIQNMISIIYEIYQNTESNFTNLGICEMLQSDKLPINYKEYMQQVDVLNKLSVSSQGDADETMFNKFANISDKGIFDFCQIQSKGRKREKSYLKTFHTYTKNISKLENSHSETKEDNINFNTLKLKTHEITGKLIFNQNVSIDSIEPIFKHLCINLIHKLVLNCCPSIVCNSLKSSEDNGELTKLFPLIGGDIEDAFVLNEKKLQSNNDYQKPNKEILTYILIHNWVIANLVKKIHSDCSEHVLQQSLDARTKFLDLYLQQDKFDILKVLYDNNKPIAALQTLHDVEKLSHHLSKLLLAKDLYACLEMLNSLPEYQLHSSIHLMSLRDQIHLKVSSISDFKLNWTYFLSISDASLQAQNVLQYLEFWSYEGATEVLLYICFNKDRNENKFITEKCREWLDRLPIYEQISQYFPESTWFDILSLSNNDPESVLQILTDSQQFELCLAWINLHQVSENIKNLITQSLLKQFLLSSDKKPFSDLNTVLSNISTHEAMRMCSSMVYQIKDLNVLKIVVDFLILNSFDASKYENIRVGILLLIEMEVNERTHFWDIRHKPLLIIEQHLMNAKFEKLAYLLNKIKPTLKTNDLGDLYYKITLINTAVISIYTVDALLRIYAQKSLELKTVKHLKLTPLSNSPAEYLQSIDSINLLETSAPYVMPEEVPPQEKWVPDNYSNCCMLCKTAIFSIIIRRHHCRRCGRLVCYLCSRHKLQIPTLYNNIKVRVCDDCHKQTNSQSESSNQERFTSKLGSKSSYSDCSSMEWCLNDDPYHNEEVRKEFQYEFSPNVSLCFTIMKMHSINSDNPRFLLSCSTYLSDAVSEAESGEASELLRMHRALLLWCTVLYSHPLPATKPFQTDGALAHTEHRLATSHALALLVSHGAHRRKPPPSKNVAYAPIPYEDALDTDCVRRLMEVEKWELALEIMTKLGMSRDGLFAAWGKACLKAGCYKMARQKFSQCFKNDPYLGKYPQSSKDLDSPVEPIASEKVLKLRRADGSAHGSRRDLSKIRGYPALLDEIVSLLENISYPINPYIMKKAESIENAYKKISDLQKSNKKNNTPSEPALNVMHTLSSLSKIKQGNYSDYTTSIHSVRRTRQLSILKKLLPQNDKLEYKRKLEPFFYEQCLYYLTSYGSHAMIIEFYLKYSNIHEVLKYCCDNFVDKEIFTDNIFMIWLKRDKINELLKEMSEIDSTWQIWSDYLLYACRVLERSGLLQALHTVQAGVGDYVRAAITCVGLYTRPTHYPHAASLLARAHYLAEARGHLQHVPRNAKPDSKELSNKSLHLKMDNGCLDKHINTICKQLEIAKFLNACEASGKLTEAMVSKILTPVATSGENPKNECFLPTLFGTTAQKINLATLVIICEHNIDEGFITALRIMKDHMLDPTKVFSQVIKYLVDNEHYEDIFNLCDRVKRCSEVEIRNVNDFIVETSVRAVVKKCDSNGQLFDELAEVIIQKANDVSVKISCYIECRILNTAYLLAVKNNRMEDLRKIMREAERLGQTQIRNTCAKKLNH